MNWPIFDLCITAINLLLSGVNLWILYQLRPYSRKKLERAARNWRANLNYDLARKLTEAIEKNATQEDQR